MPTFEEHHESAIGVDPLGTLEYGENTEECRERLVIRGAWRNTKGNSRRIIKEFLHMYRCTLNILPLALQTIFHLCIPKKDLAKP
jgi:hypothetical protein